MDEWTEERLFYVAWNTNSVPENPNMTISPLQFLENNNSPQPPMFLCEYPTFYVVVHIFFMLWIQAALSWIPLISKIVRILTK